MKIKLLALLLLSPLAAATAPLIEHGQVQRDGQCFGFSAPNDSWRLQRPAAPRRHLATVIVPRRSVGAMVIGVGSAHSDIGSQISTLLNELGGAAEARRLDDIDSNSGESGERWQLQNERQTVEIALFPYGGGTDFFTLYRSAHADADEAKEAFETVLYSYYRPEACAPCSGSDHCTSIGTPTGPSIRLEDSSDALIILDDDSGLVQPATPAY